MAAGMSEAWGDDTDRIRDILFEIGCGPAWGEVRVEAGYRCRPESGFHLAAAIETRGEGHLFYIRLKSEDVVTAPAEDWLEVCTLRVGWQASSETK